MNAITSPLPFVPRSTLALEQHQTDKETAEDATVLFSLLLAQQTSTPVPANSYPATASITPEPQALVPHLSSQLAVTQENPDVAAVQVKPRLAVIRMLSARTHQSDTRALEQARDVQQKYLQKGRLRTDVAAMPLTLSSARPEHLAHTVELIPVSLCAATYASRTNAYLHQSAASTESKVAISRTPATQIRSIPPEAGSFTEHVLDIPAATALAEAEFPETAAEAIMPEYRTKLTEVFSSNEGMNHLPTPPMSDSLANGVSSSLAELSISPHVATAKWPAALGRQLLVLLQRNDANPNIAELRLDPPELGPLRVSLSLVDNVAQAAFFSSHLPVRNAVENALPQLQQLLAQAGISLGQTSINDQHDPKQPFQQDRTALQTYARAIEQTSAETLTPGAMSGKRAMEGLVDIFA